MPEPMRWWACVIAWCALMVALFALAILLNGATPPKSAVLWASLRMVTTMTMGAVGGAAGSLLAGRRSICRSLRYSRREVAARGARWGVFGALGYGGCILGHVTGAGVLAFSGAVAALVGLGGGLLAQFLNPAEKEFARADRLLRTGDAEGARGAVREYLKHAEKDPLRVARRPAAEAFLAGDRDTLDVSLELESAPAPAGRGTEAEAASRPDGLGSELVAADPAEPVADDHQAVPVGLRGRDRG